VEVAIESTIGLLAIASGSFAFVSMFRAEKLKPEQSKGWWPLGELRSVINNKHKPEWQQAWLALRMGLIAMGLAVVLLVLASLVWPAG
jgi:hypothetical protein